MNAKRIVAILAALAVADAAHANPTLTTLYNFRGTFSFGGLHGTATGVVIGNDGNLYGTSLYGGTNGYGSVFELSGPQYQTLTTLTSFSHTNGDNTTTSDPSGVTEDALGNLYVSAHSGGPTNDVAGEVIELSGTNHQTLTTLVGFNGSNGANPNGSLTTDAAGNLYGATGGDSIHNYGTVFELSGPNHQTFTSLASFNKNNGDYPLGGMAIDAAGNLYGMTWIGGTSGGTGKGTVFELSGPNYQTLTTLVNFNGANGAQPQSGLLIDAAGNLYGTTWFGGTNDAGTVFELSGPNHQTMTTLVNFTGGLDGFGPLGGLIADAAGNLYGTTEEGGAGNQGTIFELTGADHKTLITLANFNSASGSFPQVALTADAFGNLYGTTSEGGASGNGAIFELTGTGFVVPEPGSLSLLAIGGLALANRRRRRI